MKSFFIILLVSILAACGGGSGSDSPTPASTPAPTPAPTPQPVPDPTATIDFIASSSTVNTDIFVANLTASENVDSWTFDLDGVTGYVVVNGENVLIENDTVDVSSYTSKDFQLLLNHDTAGTYNIAITSFTVGEKTVELTADQDVSFTDPAATGTGTININLGVGNIMYPIQETTSTDEQEIIKGNQLEFFYMNDVKVSLYTFTRGIAGKELSQEITGEFTNLKIPAQDYIIVATATKNIHGKTVKFKGSSPKFTLSENGFGTISVNLSPQGLLPEFMEELEVYEGNYSDGDTKYLTFNDILPANTCLEIRHEENLVLKENETVALKYEYFCLPDDVTYIGWQIQTNQFMTMSFQADSMTDVYSIDLQGEYQPVRTSFSLPKGNSELDITLSNVALSDEDLKVDIKFGPGYGLSIEKLLLPTNLSYSVTIIE